MGGICLVLWYFYYFTSFAILRHDAFYVCMLLLCIYYLCNVADVDDFTLGAVFYDVYVFSDVTAID